MRLLPTDTLLGTQIAQLTGNDVDSGPALSYTLLLEGDVADTFGVLRYGGHVALTGPLDHEQRSRYTLTLRASDTRHETEANLTVLVEDVNDNVPTFTQGFYQVHALGVPAIPHKPSAAPACSPCPYKAEDGSEPLLAPLSDPHLHPGIPHALTVAQKELKPGR